MEKFTERYTDLEIVRKNIIETDAKLKQSVIQERYFQRKALGRDNKKVWEDMRNKEQNSIKETKAYLEFLEEVEKEYETKQ